MLATQRPSRSQTNGLSLTQQFQEARSRTDDLFELITPDALYLRPVAERHRLIFYLGHLEAFDWNLLQDSRSALDKLFAFGIDPDASGLPQDKAEDWPQIGEVLDYRDRVRTDLDRLVARFDSGSDPTLLNVAIEHRLMHAETLSYLLHQLPYHHKKSRPHPPAEISRAVNRREMVRVAAGIATLGADASTGQFGWDNEFKQHSIAVPEFEIDRCKVTNREFLNFLMAGGYDNPALWTLDGWAWRLVANIHHPPFWRSSSAGWLLRTMFNDVPLPPEWPVYVSHHEAAAYARWTGKSLPSEAEWHRAAFGEPGDGERLYPWGGETPELSRGNFNFRSWDPHPVGADLEAESAFGAVGMLGNGWEWTSTLFAPFPGFHAFAFYPGYSANFFDGKHFVMKGGSARTAACMLRRSFRNWFRPEYRYAYAGFRCVNR